MEMTAEDYKPATIEELADALDELVTELEAYRRRKWEKRKDEPDDDDPLRVTKFSELFKVPRDVLHQRSVVENPIEWALKRGIKEVGKMMFAVLGKTTPMVRIAEEVADRDTKNYGRRIRIIDSTFNGIGSGNDLWVS